MSNEELLNYFQERGLQVTIKDNLVGLSKNRHTIVKGKARTVHFYPTTGTIYCDPVKSKFKPYRLKEANFQRALERVVGLSNLGY